MSAKDDKPKRRRRRRKRRPKRKPEEDKFDNLRRRLDEGPLADEPKKVFIEPSGPVKMSDVLEAFVEPWYEETDSADEYRRLLMAAILAWNAALLPEDEQQDFVDDIVGSMPAAYEGAEADLKAILNELIEHKLKYFDEYKRAIIDFELRETRHDYELLVMSTLEEEPPRE